jgi:hypothetical protein
MSDLAKHVWDALASVDEEPLSPPENGEADFPLDGLGELLGGAARAIADGVQLPPAIAAQSVLASAAMAAQQFANMQINGRISPLSLFCLTVAESGDRKSSADKIATAPLDEWQRTLIEQHRWEQQDYDNQMDTYKVERETILKGNKGKREVIEQKLRAMVSPGPPVKPFVFSQEPTLEGLQKSFVGGYPSQGLFSDEGGQFFGGHAMNKDNALKTVSGLSKFWDGSAIYRTRAGQGESAVLYNRRLSIHLMVQPIVAALVLSDPLMQQQGLMARFLVVQPRSIAGSRLYNDKDPNEQQSVIRYRQRLAELLSLAPQIDEHGGLALPSLTLEDAARVLWVQCYNEIEKKLAAGQPLDVIRPTAAKMAENILRIAGVLTVIEGENSIGPQTMAGAILLGQYYLSEQLRLRRRTESDSLAQQADQIVEWMKDNNGVAIIEELQKKGPHGLRKSVSHLRKIMAVLVENKRCAVTQKNGRADPSAWRLTNV